MKLLHLADLHLGKKLNEFSLIEDQKFILEEILKIIDAEQIDGILIAGDVYDKPVPSTEALALFDDFLRELAARKIQTFIISGNHDSAERTAYLRDVIDMSGIHFSPAYTGKTTKFSLGEVDIHMLPFIKPIHAKRVYSAQAGEAPDEIAEQKDTTSGRGAALNEDEQAISTYTDAMRVTLEHSDIDSSRVNILIAHQFVTGASKAGSEELSIGGLENIDGEVFDAFDYVALGHIHKAQQVGRETMRYAGSPLKYSFSEATHKKSVPIIEIDSDAAALVPGAPAIADEPAAALVPGAPAIRIRLIPLPCLHDMAEIKGTYAELTSKTYYEGTTLQKDFLHITLTDEEDVPNALAKLGSIYKNIMILDYDNKRTRASGAIKNLEKIESINPIDIFDELYETQNGQKMSGEQRNIIASLAEEIWEDR